MLLIERVDYLPDLGIGGNFVSAEGIIFDKDGTLNDSLAVMPGIVARRVRAIIESVPESAGLEEKLSRAIGLSGGKMIRRSPAVVGTRLETAAAAATLLYLERNIPWDRSLGYVLKAFAAVDKELRPGDRFLLFPGVKETLARLSRAGYRLAVATNDDLEQTGLFLRYTSLGRYIAVIACADEVKRGKPHPDLAQEAARRMGLRPDRCILCGDSVWDMEMGRRAGMLATVGVLSGSAGREELSRCADIIIPGVAGVKVVDY